MSENIDNLILEHLKAIRGQLNRIEGDLTDLKGRDHVQDGYLAALHGDTARQSGRLNEQDRRLAQIERRLELRDME